MSSRLEKVIDSIKDKLSDQEYKELMMVARSEPKPGPKPARQVSQTVDPYCEWYDTWYDPWPQQRPYIVNVAIVYQDSRSKPRPKKHNCTIQ